MTKKNFLESSKKCSFIIFFASQTGQAESIAENIAQQATDFDFTAEAFPLNDIREVKEITNLPCPVLIIASTTGDGEPPENADRFWRKIRRKNLASDTLVDFRYTLLGLGDTNYNQFCNCGKEIHRRLQDLGATTFLQPSWADDAVGLEVIVEDWIDELWSALEKLLRPGIMTTKTKQEGGMQLPICPPASLLLEYEDSNIASVNFGDPIQPYPLIDTLPMETVITEARCLTKPGAVKTALELTLKFKSKKFDFEPGDAIGVVCPNSVEEVSRLITRLDLTSFADKLIILSVKKDAKGKIPAFSPPSSSIRQHFIYYCDIRTPPKKNFLRLLAEYTKDDSEKSKLLELSSRQGAALYESTIRFPGLSLLDILLTFPSCQPPPEVLLEHLPRLIPRAYSISSSSMKDKESFKFAFNVITFSEEEGRKYSRRGVCSGWLYDVARPFLKSEDFLDSEFSNLSLNDLDASSKEIFVYRRKNHNFRLPENVSSPLILVGPGTGIAPFLGFAQHRDEQKNNGLQIGEIHLYFGCRNKSLDFLYEEELHHLVKADTISKLHVSFSRDEAGDDRIKYVQHNIEKNQDEFVDILFNKLGFLYVCGDAKNMAKNVRETVTKCVQVVKGISVEEAKTLVAELVSSKRYLQDVWS